MIHQPFNLKLDDLTAFNIRDRDRTIAQLRKDLKQRNKQLRDAQKVTIIYASKRTHQMNHQPLGNQIFEGGPCRLAKVA
jgi:hypothetical protein